MAKLKDIFAKPKPGDKGLIPDIKEGIETIFTGLNNLQKSRKISKLALEKGYRRLGATGKFYPADMLEKGKDDKYVFKDKTRQIVSDNHVIVTKDEMGVPVSHQIVQRVDAEGRVPHRDQKTGKIKGYIKRENLDQGGGIGNYKRSEKDLERVKNLQKQVVANNAKQHEIRLNKINEFFELNSDLKDISKVDNKVVEQLRDFIGPSVMGTAKGTKIATHRLRKILEEQGLYKKIGGRIDDVTKQQIRNYLLKNDNWKTLSTQQVIKDLNLQDKISAPTLMVYRRSWPGEGDRLVPIPKERKNLQAARRKYDSMMREKYGGQLSDTDRNKLTMAFSDYLGDAYGVERKQGFTSDQIDEAFKFVEDTELGMNTPEGGAYQEMFESNRLYNEQKLAEINAEREIQGLKPLNQNDPSLDDVMMTMGHARLNPATGKMGAFDLSKVEPETRAKNYQALNLGRRLQAAIKEDNLPAVDRIITEMVNKGIRHEVVLPGRKFKGTGELEGLADTIDDTFVIGGEAPEPFPYELLAKGGMVGEDVLQETMVDEETGMMDYLTDNPLYNNVIKPIEEARDAKTEEYDLENNPQRVLPVMIGEALELPGEAYDALPNWLEGDDAILKNLGNPNAPSVALAKAATGLMGMMTDPVARLTKNIGDPDRITTIPYPTWEKKEDGQYHYKDMQTLELPSDNPIAIGIDTLKTAGLGAAEILLAFNPTKLIKLGANPNLAQKVGKFLVNDLAGPLIALTTAHKAADVLDSKQSEELNQAVDQMQKETDKLIDDMENIEDAAEFGDSQDPGYGFSGDYANDTFAYGGEVVTPGPFAESMQTGLEEEIDIQDLDLGPAYEGFDDLDIFEEAERGGNQPVEVALNLNKVVGEVPKWVKQGKERFKMAMDNLLPGRNTPDTGTDVAIVDDVVENVTPLTRSEPGQIFYHQMEAELEQGPKVYNSSKEVYDFLNARGIGKVEVIDSEIKPMLEKLEGMGQPITREMLLGVVRESPIRNVKSGGYGFLSDTLDGEMRSLNYSGYKEKGGIPNTDRERVLYVDPKDLRGDTGSLPGSVSTHSFSEPYVIAWSRLSDRELGGAFTGKTTTFADEIQSDIFQASQRVAGKLAAKMRHMADQGIPFDRIENDLQQDMMKYFKDKGSVFRESMPSASALKVEYDKLVALQDQLRQLSKTPVPEITDEMLTAAKGVQAEQTAVLDSLVDSFNLQLNKQLFPNLPFKLRDQWADASIKRDIYEAAYRKFVLKDPNATDFYAITPANLVTKRYGHAGSTKTPQADRIADKNERLERWVRNGMEGDIPNSQFPGVGMYEFYGGPGTDVVTEGGKHFTSSMEKTLKRIAKENNVKVEVLPVKIGDDAKDIWNVINKETGEILGTGDTARQADAIANDLLLDGMKIKVDRTKQFDTAPSFGVELTPSMAEAFKAYMASGGYVGDEEIVGAYGD
tara:strand:- start:3115 stop:7434 length:4320 start_codon:yes stop_codon:yes gene_type:complete